MLCHDVANDIVQDVFIDFFQKTKNGVRVAFPKSYLYRSTLNKCIDEQRKNRKFAGNQIPEGIQDSHHDYEKRETRECIGNCLADVLMQMAGS
jgi:DNA-directed RNA polymerase specialized sigma24 family protein